MYGHLFSGLHRLLPESVPTVAHRRVLRIRPVMLNEERSHLQRHISGKWLDLQSKSVHPARGVLQSEYRPNLFHHQ